MLAPVMVVILGLFCGGIILGVSDGLTLAHFRDLAKDSEFRLSLVFTTLVACIATLLSSAGGLAVALAVRPLVKSNATLYTLLQTPLAIPHLAMAFFLIHMISPSGLLARIAHASGLIAKPADFGELVNDKHGLGILITYLAKEIPFIAVMVLALLLRIGDEHDEVARTLGATRWQRLRHVTLPMVWPALVAASIFVFAYVFSAFEIPFLLGRPYPAMLSVVTQRRYMAIDLAERPGAVAIAVVMSVLTSVIVWAYLNLTRRVGGTGKPIFF